MLSNNQDPGEGHRDSGAPGSLTVDPAFILLFPINLNGAFTGFKTQFAGIAPLPPPHLEGYITQLARSDTNLLGRAFIESRRMARWPLGRVALDGLHKDAPAYGDVFLVSHKAGVALWEVWLHAPNQPFDASRWIGWLDPDIKGGLIERLWRVLGPVNEKITGNPAWSGLYFPLIILRSSHYPLEAIVERHRTDLVHLLFLDHSHRAF